MHSLYSYIHHISIFIHAIDICIFINAYILMHSYLVTHTLWCIHLANHKFDILIHVKHAISRYKSTFRSVYLSLCLYICMSMSASWHLSIYVSLTLRISRSTHFDMPRYLHVRECVFISFFLRSFVSSHFFNDVFSCLCTSRYINREIQRQSDTDTLYAFVSLYLFVALSTYLYVFVYLCLSISLSMCLHVCVSHCLSITKPLHLHTFASPVRASI